MTVTQDNNTPLSALLQSTAIKPIGLQVAWATLRIFVGLLMVHNGFDKLKDVPGFAENVVAFIGLPYPVFLTYCAAYTEIFGSILLALGLLTRLNAAALLITMLVAIFFHLKGDGFKIPPLETASLYALSYLFFLINGGGAFSVDSLLLKPLQATKSVQS
ncbi:MAG: DoxX family protein [Cyanobacteria bacterium RM1_2_2]|nr:DoxX family protein [Cyanobacteria bacterium RM1_2_2]